MPATRARLLKRKPRLKRRRLPGLNKKTHSASARTRKFLRKGSIERPGGPKPPRPTPPQK